MTDQLREASAFFETLNATAAIDDAWALYQAEVGQWGICNILYGFTSHLEPLTGRPEFTLFSNYSVQWEEAYDRLGGMRMTSMSIIVLAGKTTCFGMTRKSWPPCRRKKCPWNWPP